MRKTYEPDSQFVERLEWQLASEYRRTKRMKSAGKIAVPRRIVTITFLIGALLTGVAAIKAAETIKDSWRKKIEVARVETDVKLKTAHLEATREMSARAERLVSIGMIQPEEYQVMKLGTEKATWDLKRSLLVLDEVKISGLVPRNELSAPLVGGRDFVSDRLKIEKKVIELDLELLESHLGRFQQLLKTAMVPGDQVDRIQAEIAARKGTIDMIQERLDLRKRLVAGEITAQEVEIKDRLAGAEDRYRQAQTRVETLKEQLIRLQALEAIGMVSATEVKQLQYALDAAQAELQLAALEKDVLEKLR
jgi:hypothetical protein